MSLTCPNGHESKWPDWCSTCGERIGDVSASTPAAATATPPADATPPVAAPPPATGPACENCGVQRHEHDVFCESCGYDFASGSLPEGATDSDNADAGDAVEVSADPMHAKVFVDPDFFAASAGDSELTLPDPIPSHQVVPLPGIRILIGRQSTSRGIFPEIDVRALTDDPAVSSRHAMLERDVTGDWTLTDLGSTNGTFLSADAEEAIEAGVALPIAAGTSIYIGAWTRIDVAASEQ